MSQAKDKTLWIPRDWQKWAETYMKENKEEMQKLGIKTVNDLVWRLAELGKTDLAKQVSFSRTLHHSSRPTHEKTE